MNKRADCTYIDRMKRFAALFLALSVALPALAIDLRKRSGTRESLRITVLQAPIYGEYEDRVATRVRRQLVEELRERGLDADDGAMSFDDLARSGRGDADFFVEVVPTEDYAHPIGGVAVNVPNATVDVSVVVSRVAADLRIYDRKLNLVAKRHLRHNSTSVVPTGVGVGTYRMSMWFALPIVEYLRYRNAVNGVVRDAAREVTSVIR